MDQKTAEPTSRRRLLALAGLAGATAVAAIARPANASPPNQPTEADKELLAGMLAAELAVADLYRLAIETGASDEVLGQIQMNHQQYAQAIGASIGQSPSVRDEALFEEWSPAFESTDDTAVAAEAVALEHDLVATHLDQVSQFEGVDPVVLSSSILVVEGRHATVLASLAGDGLSEMLVSGGSPLTLTTPSAGADS